MKKYLLVPILLLSIVMTTQAAWFVSQPLTVDCMRYAKNGQTTMSVTIRGNQVTVIDHVKPDEQTYTTRVTQSSRSKHWNSPEINMAVSLKAVGGSRFFGGGNHHHGSLEIKSLPEDSRDFSFYCYPKEIVE